MQSDTRGLCLKTFLKAGFNAYGPRLNEALFLFRADLLYNNIAIRTTKLEPMAPHHGDPDSPHETGKLEQGSSRNYGKGGIISALNLL